MVAHYCDWCYRDWMLPFDLVFWAGHSWPRLATSFILKQVSLLEQWSISCTKVDTISYILAHHLLPNSFWLLRKSQSKTGHKSTETGQNWPKLATATSFNGKALGTTYCHFFLFIFVLMCRHLFFFEAIQGTQNQNQPPKKTQKNWGEQAARQRPRPYLCWIIVRIDLLCCCKPPWAEWKHWNT